MQALFRIRRTIRALERIAQAEEAQAVALGRLAEKFAPADLPADEAEVRRGSQIDFSRDQEQARILDFSRKVQQDLGREPSEQEIVDFLDGVPVR